MLAVNGVNVAGTTAEVLGQLLAEAGDELELLLMCRENDNHILGIKVRCWARASFTVAKSDGGTYPL
jgi:hypothetical protein